MSGWEGTGRRKGRRLSRDRAGAAEIIGDILLVAMSVIMVAALALQLSTVQEPQDSVRADLVASYDGENITVLHMGGEALQQHNTRFQVFTNDTYTRYANITDGKSGNSWQVGENWTLAFPTNPTQRVRIQVIDTKNSVVILEQALQRGPDATMVPDLGLAANDITLLFEGHTFNDTNGPMANDAITVNVTVHNYGPAPAYNFTVRVTDYSNLDRRSYPVMAQNLSLNGTSSQTLSAAYTIPAGSWGMHTLSVRIVPLPNETRFANNYASTEYRAGYTVIASHPGNPVLRIRSIESFPRFPVHGAYVNLSARISNQGGVPANATVQYYLGSVSAPNLIGIESGLGVPVGGESLSTIVWRTPRGGTHTIIVNATDPSGSTDQEMILVEVLPTILVVDDDRAGEGGLRDVGASMREALNSVAASFTVHTVLGGGDGPLYDAGERPLQDYDLVIWLAGYEAGTTITPNDQVQLGKYLDNKGRLWLIGQDVVSGLGRNHPFLNNYMKVSPGTPLGWLNVGLTSVIEGSGPLAGINLTMGLPFPTGLTDRADTVNPLATAAAAFVEDGGGNPFAILFNATTNGTPGDDTYRTCLFGFEPSRIKSANERSIMTFEMLRWFGVGAAWGRDLGVSDQAFSKSTPAFMETINITIYLRNNGVADEPVDVSRPQLQVGFYVDGAVFDPVNVTIEAYGGNTSFDPPTSEIWIPQDTGNASLRVPGNGGFIKITMAWVADRIGSHVVAGVVDPYDYIQELNELNNEVSSASSKTVYVRYGTLVVDDDMSPNNGGGLYDATGNITSALDLLGYTYDQVNTTGAGDGPGISKMELYNAIIWVCGEVGGALTANDRANLKTFLDKGDGRYMWLVGPRSVPNGDYTGASSFYRDYLRVGRVDNPVGQRTPSYVEGALLDPVAHGTRYPATPTYSDAAHKLVPYIDGLGMIYEKPMPTTALPNEVAYSDGAYGATTGWYKHVVQPLTTSDIANVYDAQRGGGVIQLTRAGAHLLDNYFLVGDYSLSNDQNPNSLPWKDDQRAIAKWSFKSAIGYTFIWHVTDTVNVKHTLTYTSSDANNLAAEPVMHGLGSWTADGVWHTVTRDLLADLREGAGNGGLNIREVDGFEVAINTGTLRVDDIGLARPFMAIRHDNVTNNFRTAFFAWDPSFISYTDNSDYCAELVYQVMGWFNMYDERPELRVTHLDLFHTNLTPLRDMKPMMGESYMLKARVWNPGGTRGDAVVRFSDGTTVIESVSVSVEHDSYILAEVIWTPLYAGNRTLSAWVDPDNLQDEIFKFNNRAQMAIQTYFFYDDMENGAGKWDHSATIARLNGESTLEYMDPGPVSSNILGEWSEYNGWKNTTDNATLTNITTQYHSQNKAFYMHEPQSATRTPVDVVLTMDATGSMQWETPCKAEGVKSAMLQFVNRLNSNDRGAISAFTTSYPFNSDPNPPLIPWYNRLYTPLTSNKGLLADGIVNITVTGGTPFWNSVVVSFTYIQSYGDSARIRCMVILTDGDSNSDQPNVPAGRAAAFAKVRTAQIPVFVIGYGAAIHLTAIETDMINLAAEANLSGGGGGWYYYSPGPSDIKQVFENISKKIEELAQTLGRGGAPAAPAAAGPAASGPSPRIVLFSDNMESGAGSWVVRDQAQAGTTWRRVSSEYQGSGIWSWRCRDGGNSYANNNDDWLITPVFDAQGYHDLKLSFWHRPAMRRNGGFDAGFVFLSNNNGATWVGIQCFSDNIEASASANPVTVSDILLDALAPTAQMRVAFRMWSDGGGNAQGWSVDDVTVTGVYGYARSGEGAAAPQATVTMLQEGFELAAPPGWTTTNSAPASSFWQRDGTFKHTDSYAFRCYDNGLGTYRKNDDDTLISPVFDLSGGYTSPLLTFWHRTDVKAGDKCYADISNNNGATWTNVWWSDTENNTWAAVLGLDMTASGSISLTNQMKLRFRFFSDNDNNVDTGWSVDDVLITAVTPPAGPPPETVTRNWNDGDETPRDKWMTTPTFSLTGVSSAKLTFWHKYNLKVGGNGGVLMVGTCSTEAGPYLYRYLTPTQPYSNNLKIADWGSAHLKDDFGTDMRWCWNGISGAGKFTWDYVQADLTPYVGNQYVRVRFMYLFCGGGTGFGWAVDDVEIKVHRSNAVAVTAAASDQWELVTEGQMYGDDFADGRFAYSGTHAWWNHNPRAGIDTLKGGIDNSLVTIPIDLSRAKDARLEAKLRFNVMYAEGRPPDGFRVEVSSDLGISWRQINMGVRSSWNVSGTEAAGPDGTSYTGVNIVDNWVSSGTVTRLNCDISGWAGSVIQIRFRVVTRNDTVNHHQDLGPGFGGFFIDDVTVIGNTTTGQGRSVTDERAAYSGQRTGETEGNAADGPTGAGTDSGAVDGRDRANPDRPAAERLAADSARKTEMPSPARCPLYAARSSRPGDCWFPTE